MRRTTIAVTLAVALMLGALPAGADLVGPGSPDRRFSGDGIARLKLGTFTFFTGVALQGRTTVAAGAASVGGEWDAVLARYTRRGALDRSFGGDGTVRLDVGGYDGFFDVVVLPDGRLLAVGTSIGATRTRFLVVRYHADGRLDRSFGKAGIALTAFTDPEAQAYSAVALPSGKAVVCGLTRDLGADQSGFALARYRASGALDRTFGGDGRVVTRFPVRPENVCTGLGVTSDGQIVAAGFATSSGPGTTVVALARYRSNGRLEPSFGDEGLVEITPGNYTTAEDVLVVGHDSLVIAGQWQRPSGGYAAYVAKVKPRGAMDTTFGNDGVRVVSAPGGDAKLLSLASAPGGDIVGVGEWSMNVSPYTAFALIARLRSSGRLDGGFGTDGVVTMSLAPSGDSKADAVQVLADGRIVFAGETESAGAVVRLKG